MSNPTKAIDNLLESGEITELTPEVMNLIIATDTDGILDYQTSLDTHECQECG